MRLIIFVYFVLCVSACAQKSDLASQYSPQSISSTQPSAKINSEYARLWTTDLVAVDLGHCAAGDPSGITSSSSLAQYILRDTKPGQRITVDPEIISIYAKSVSDEAAREGRETVQLLAQNKIAYKACFARQIGQSSAGPARAASLNSWKAKTHLTGPSSPDRDRFGHVIRSFENLYNQLEVIMTSADPEELVENIAREFLPVTINLPNADPPLGKRS